jgi:D-alanyl-D-alanine carboxypeptidase/D-alanyl-D-alanine-endopeptidase (penicillin-binding protein 4)
MRFLVSACLVTIGLLWGCSPRALHRAELPALRPAQVGICLLDAASGRVLYERNACRYFTPASSTKILTLTSCLYMLRDSLPRLAHGRSEEGLVWAAGTGDPTFLHPKFEAWQPTPPPADLLYELPGGSAIAPLGPGWNWDDLGAYYAAETSTLPMYGNAVEVLSDAVRGWVIRPGFLDSLSRPASPEVNRPYREPFGRWIWMPEGAAGESGTLTIPVWQASRLMPEVFRAQQGTRPVWTEDGILATAPPAAHSLWYACPTDTVLRRMMHQSDNFLAEQLLLLCSVERYGAVHPSAVRSWVTDTLLPMIHPQPKWVDGSGLSRYNLNSPAFLARLLHTLWQTQDPSRLLDLFPEGGREGTLMGRYGHLKVWAKSGSMTGVYCLSGFLAGDDGQMRVFSIMINGFICGQQPVRAAVEDLLTALQKLPARSRHHVGGCADN